MKKLISAFILLCFIATGIIGPCPVYAQDFILPVPGQMVALSPAFSPAVLKGIKLDPKNPFRFHFFVESGDSKLKREDLKNESSKLIKYFLASLTIPEKDLWVNLSPYEKDRIVPQEFGQTEMGRDLLAEDYLLKQITASLIYPESHLGKEFWQKVYGQAQSKYGTTNIPINTFNKVWIVPEKAVVYENGGVAFVLENHLKVMLEQDYLSLSKHQGQAGAPRRHVPEGGVSPSRLPSDLGSNVKAPQGTKHLPINTLTSQIIKEIVIPALTKEVNEGKNFAQLRQVFYSLILATWYKKKIKDSLLNKVYSNQNKIMGLSPSRLPSKAGLNAKATQRNEPTDIEAIYQQYLKAFKKGVYSYIKEEPDSLTNQTIPRKYFSGGVVGSEVSRAIIYKDRAQITYSDIVLLNRSNLLDITADAGLINPQRISKSDEAMNAREEAKNAVLYNLNQRIEKSEFIQERLALTKTRRSFLDLFNDHAYSDLTIRLIAMFIHVPGIEGIISRLKTQNGGNRLGVFEELFHASLLVNEGFEITGFDLTIKSISQDVLLQTDLLAKKDQEYYFVEVKHSNSSKEPDDLASYFRKTSQKNNKFENYGGFFEDLKKRGEHSFYFSQLRQKIGRAAHDLIDKIKNNQKYEPKFILSISLVFKEEVSQQDRDRYMFKLARSPILHMDCFKADMIPTIIVRPFINAGLAANNRIIISGGLEEKILRADNEIQLKEDLESILNKSYFVKAVKVIDVFGKENVVDVLMFRINDLEKVFGSDFIKLRHIREITIYYLLKDQAMDSNAVISKPVDRAMNSEPLKIKPLIVLPVKTHVPQEIIDYFQNNYDEIKVLEDLQDENLDSQTRVLFKNKAFPPGQIRVLFLNAFMDSRLKGTKYLDGGDWRYEFRRSEIGGTPVSREPDSGAAIMPPDGAMNAKEESRIQDRKDRYETAVAIMEHGGPLNILGAFQGIVSDLGPLRRQELFPILSENKKLPELLVNEVKRYYQIGGNMYDLYKKSLPVTDLEGSEKIFNDWLASLQEILIKHCSELKRPGFDEEIDRLVSDPEESKAMKHFRSDALSSIERWVFNFEAIRALWNRNRPKQHIRLDTWLKRNWETKQKKHEVVSHPPVGNLPEVLIHEAALHLVLERIISNGFKEIENQEASPGEGLEKVDIYPEAFKSQDGRDWIRVNIISPGKIPEEALIMDESRKRQKIFALDPNRPYFSHGVAMPFSWLLMESLGGTIYAQNINQEGRPYTKVTVEFPSRPADGAMKVQKQNEAGIGLNPAMITVEEALQKITAIVEEEIARTKKGYPDMAKWFIPYAKAGYSDEELRTLVIKASKRKNGREGNRVNTILVDDQKKAIQEGVRQVVKNNEDHLVITSFGPGAMFNEPLNCLRLALGELKLLKHDITTITVRIYDDDPYILTAASQRHPNLEESIRRIGEENGWQHKLNLEVYYGETGGGNKKIWKAMALPSNITLLRHNWFYLYRNGKKNLEALTRILREKIEAGALIIDERLYTEGFFLNEIIPNAAMMTSKEALEKLRPIIEREPGRDKNKYPNVMPVPLKGGIDFNPAKMGMQVKKEGADFKFDFNGTQIDAAQVTGATFTIKQMTPVTDLIAVLGISILNKSLAIQ
ncbi:MAG: sensor histidine kinase [Candidatus Omnitrophica bacterium]|nr:sensor histidine kinase [Candidatus Omnitrophota bacterium]